MRRIKNTSALQDSIEKALHARDLSLSGVDDRAAQKGLNRPNSKTVGRWISGEVESINEGSLTDFAKILDVPYLELRQELGLLSNGETIRENLLTPSLWKVKSFFSLSLSKPMARST